MQTQVTVLLPKELQLTKRALQRTPISPVVLRKMTKKIKMIITEEK